jgi:osmotically-inducible protein OsmY
MAMLKSLAKSTVQELASDADERILCDVMRQIIWQADIDAHAVRLTVNNGVVQFYGTVETCTEKVEAENAAKAVFGVVSVINDLAVAPHRLHEDSEIARDIDSSLRICTTVLEQAPEISVSQGTVVLDGRCRWEFQKLCAERIALSTIGVKRVVNLMKVGSATARLVPALPTLELAARAG